MKKFIFVMPLMAISLLACNKGGGDNPPEPDIFTVTFDANGGTLSGESSIKVNSGTLFKDIANKPTASKEPVEAYLFNGWGLTKDTQIPIDDYKITGDLTVYAIYTPKAYATVTFSEESKNCTLSYNGETLTRGVPCKIPAGVDVALKIESNQDYFPILDGDVEIQEAQTYNLNLIEQEIIVKVAKDNTCVIKAEAENAPRENLESYEWSEINILSKAGLAETCFEVGNTKAVRLNGQDFDHTVRIIGFNHDDLADGSGKVGITFEFAEIISKDNVLDGEIYETIWDGTYEVSGNNFDYRKSVLNSYLNDETNTESIINMLPNDLKKEGIIKSVSKLVGVSDSQTKRVENFEAKPFSTKLFPLAYDELHDPEETPSHITPGEAGKNGIYKFYKGHSGDDSEDINYRRKDKVGGYSFQGTCWLRSPTAFFGDEAALLVGGDPRGSVVVYYLRGISPAFCI